MKVIVKAFASSATGWLGEGEILTVLAMNVSPLEGVKYLIWSAAQETVALFPGTDFDLVDKHLSPRWVVRLDPTGNFDLGPEAWQVDGFWEKYHDGNSVAEQIFEKEKSLIEVA
ncbi:hypothetical protein ACK3BK_07615 [Pseudomonas sp. L7]|uniref:hypothetical protein n=1 Tax=Pseudomonas sp. L7 TaxID=3388343 RepID=UPI003984F73E